MTAVKRSYGCRNPLSSNKLRHVWLLFSVGMGYEQDFMASPSMQQDVKSTLVRFSPPASEDSFGHKLNLAHARRRFQCLSIQVYPGKGPSSNRHAERSTSQRCASSLSQAPAWLHPFLRTDNRDYYSSIVSPAEEICVLATVVWRYCLSIVLVACGADRLGTFTVRTITVKHDRRLGHETGAFARSKTHERFSILLRAAFPSRSLSPLRSHKVYLLSHNWKSSMRCRWPLQGAISIPLPRVELYQL